jgi:hypothetical protein
LISGAVIPIEITQMDEKLSKRIALALLKAGSVDEINSILKDDEACFYFDDPQNWSSYGNRDKNWDTVGNQQTNPVGALVEIVTNGIDAILLRKAAEQGTVDPRSPEAPQSMEEAVKRYFSNVVEGKIARLEPTQRSILAQQCVQIAIQRSHRKNYPYPTYTITDSGSGQLPEEFPRTFLSLSEKNKEGIPFVQGKFNMGSTGSLRFCTRSDIRLGHFKFILSRRPGQPYWGWTLVRVRPHRKGEELPVAEYFHMNRAAIPKFRDEKVHAFGHPSLGVLCEGSVVKLYEYDIGPEARAIDLGLYNALTVSLIECALPIQLYDFNADHVAGKGALRAEGIAARTFGGLNVVLRAELAGAGGEESVEQGTEPSNKAVTEWVHQVTDVHHEELGRVRIVAYAVTRLHEFLGRQPARIFYTLNGQTHAIERASFLNTKVGLPDLRNHILINVICNDMNKEALATTFMPDRERRANTDLSRMLEQLLISELKEDSRLRTYAAAIRLRRASEHVEDSEATADLIRELVKSDPAIRELFGLGTFLPDIGPIPHGDEPFKGKKYPTFLNPLNLRLEDGQFVKEVPVQGYRRIECGTDADDDYLIRIDSPGEAWCSLDGMAMPHSVKLRNGVARFTIAAPKAADVGQFVEAEFGFKDYGRNIEPLKFRVLIRYIEAEPTQTRKSGKPADTKPGTLNIVGEPKFNWVPEAQWDEHGFDDESGAYVTTGEKTVVNINQDNRHLRTMRAREKDEATRLMNENMFRLGLGLFALAIHKKALNGKADGEDIHQPDPEAVTRLATSGMAPYVVTVIRKLGGA